MRRQALRARTARRRSARRPSRRARGAGPRERVRQRVARVAHHLGAGRRRDRRPRSSGSVPSEKNRRCVRSASPWPSAAVMIGQHRRAIDRRAGRGHPDLAEGLGDVALEARAAVERRSAPPVVEVRGAEVVAHVRRIARVLEDGQRAPERQQRAGERRRRARRALAGDRRPPGRRRTPAGPTSFSGASSHSVDGRPVRLNVRAGRERRGARRPSSNSMPQIVADLKRARPPATRPLPRRGIVEEVLAALGRASSR